MSCLLIVSFDLSLINCFDKTIRISYRSEDRLAYSGCFNDLQLGGFNVCACRHSLNTVTTSEGGMTMNTNLNRCMFTYVDTGVLC